MPLFAFRILGFISLGLAVAGAVLPVMPTTVFVILAAWAFAKSSPALHAKLLAHPRFGPVLADWEAHGAIPRKGKIAAVIGMAASLAILIVTGAKPLVLGAAGVALAASAAFVVTRPAPPSREAPVEEQA
jgi:uncharacterized membrane protein YbaN (DUF454 family)